MYIKYEDIKPNDVTIDVRTKEEYESMTLLEHNLPVISREEHQLLKKRIYLTIPIVLKGFFKNKSILKNRLHELSHYRRYRLIIGCSQGRVRSPIVYFYAKYLGIDAKVLKGGIKPHFGFRQKNLKNLYGFLDI